MRIPLVGSSPGGYSSTNWLALKKLVYDEVSGITYEVAEYPGFGQTTFHVRIAWGWKVINPAHVAVLFG